MLAGFPLPLNPIHCPIIPPRREMTPPRSTPPNDPITGIHGTTSLGIVCLDLAWTAGLIAEPLIYSINGDQD
jgi:hypothetical protein